MKSLILATLLVVSSMMAQTQATPLPAIPPTVQLMPFGIWALCADNPQLPLCKLVPQPIGPFAPKPYQLLVVAADPLTSAFAYSISIIRQNGSSATYTGMFERNDNPAKGLIASHVELNFGGVVESAVITVTELHAGYGYTTPVVVDH